MLGWLPQLQRMSLLQLAATGTVPDAIAPTVGATAGDSATGGYDAGARPDAAVRGILCVCIICVCIVCVCIVCVCIVCVCIVRVCIVCVCLRACTDINLNIYLHIYNINAQRYVICVYVYMYTNTYTFIHVHIFSKTYVRSKHIPTCTYSHRY